MWDLWQPTQQTLCHRRLLPVRVYGEMPDISRGEAKGQVLLIPIHHIRREFRSLATVVSMYVTICE